MRLAKEALDTAYGLIQFHLRRTESGESGFHVALEPGPLTDLIASAAVIVELEVLRDTAALLGWTLDDSKIEELLTDARAANEAAASGDLVPDPAHSSGDTSAD